jgi:hypothetical protein
MGKKKGKKKKRGNIPRKSITAVMGVCRLGMWQL